MASEEMIENIKTTKCRGIDGMKNFIARFTNSNQQGCGNKETYYDSIKKQKVISFETKKKTKNVIISEDENKSFGEIFSCFEGKKLNLRMIMDWPVTSKPYAIAAEDGKIRSKAKSLFRNNLQLLCPEKPTKHPSLTICSSVVDAMRVVRFIPINDTNPTTFLSWAKKISGYIESLPGEVVHIVFDNYSPVDNPSKVLSKGRPNKGIERKISNLNQMLPKLNEWQDFLTNDKNKFQICNLLADYFTSADITTRKTIYVTKERLCYMKSEEMRRVEPDLYSSHREADHRYVPFLFKMSYYGLKAAHHC